MATDPFSLVYDALWDTAVAYDAFADLVALKSRISFNDDANRSPVKNLIAPADLPEVILAPVGGSGDLFHTSCSSMVIKRYMWLISTGDLRVDAGKLFPVEFALMRAMCHWQTRVSPLTWAGNTFVKRLDMLDLSEGESDAERNRGIKGWSALWTCEVEMHFATSQLKADD